jgi:GNAT superfamily N-acetyltransferase
VASWSEVEDEGLAVALEVRPEPFESGVAQQMVAGFEAAIRERYEGWTPTIGPTATKADFSPPAGNFLVAYLDGEPVGCGGLKRLASDTVEVKRVYVRPDVRGRGVSRALLGALEDAARNAGYALIRLDTGANQPEALKLFQTSGYMPIPDYNDNPWAAYWFEKRVSPSSQAPKSRAGWEEA